MINKLKVVVEDDGVVRIEGDEGLAFRAQAVREVEIELFLEGYRQVFMWRGAVPQVVRRPKGI